METKWTPIVATLILEGGANSPRHCMLQQWEIGSAITRNAAAQSALDSDRGATVGP